MSHAERLAETLLWLCRVPSPIGEERDLCDAVADRLARVALAGPIRRYGDSIVVPVTRVRLLVVGAATLGTAAAVAVSGLIGFVGIVVPHAVRLLAGSSYRVVLPLSALFGAAFLVLADVAARTALAPAELPIGVVTACIGAPFFVVVLRTARTVRT